MNYIILILVKGLLFYFICSSIKLFAIEVSINNSYKVNLIKCTYKSFTSNYQQELKNDDVVFYRKSTFRKISSDNIIAIDENYTYDDRMNISFFPTPTVNYINLTIISDKQQSMKVEIFTLDGIKVFQKSIKLNIGINSSIIDCIDLSNGIYYLSIYSMKHFIYPLIIVR